MSIDLLGHFDGVFFDMLHLLHDVLQFLLDYLLLTTQCDILGNSLSTGISMGVLNPQYPPIRWLSLNSSTLADRLSIRRDDTLTAQRLAEIRIEEFIALLVNRTLPESERLVAGRNAHVLLEDLRLMEVAIVV